MSLIGDQYQYIATFSFLYIFKRLGDLVQSIFEVRSPPRVKLIHKNFGLSYIFAVSVHKIGSKCLIILAESRNHELIGLL